MHKKLKSFIANDAVFYTLLIVLVAVASFGLGKRSFELEKALIPQTAEQTALVPMAPIVGMTAGEEGQVYSAVVASKSGTKYHLPECPGAKQMKPENRLEFESIAAAEAAGYTPAANCPGL